jgi:hypothetical protein
MKKKKSGFFEHTIPFMLDMPIPQFPLLERINIATPPMETDRQQRPRQKRDDSDQHNNRPLARMAQGIDQ